MKQLGVIIPVYNTEEYLNECLRSIESSVTDPSSVEIVIVDDGSSDRSGVIADEFAGNKRNVRVIHQENRGVFAAIKRGIKELQCQYITVVDSDDWIEKHTYESLIPFLDQSIDIIQYPMDRYRMNSNSYRKAESEERSGVYDKSLIREQLFPTMIWNIDTKEHGLNPSLCNKIIKRDFFVSSLEKIDNLGGNYGQDMVILYPIMLEIESYAFAQTGKYYHRIRENRIPPYISNKGFFRNLTEVYEYLRACYMDFPEVVEQLDFFYSDTSQLKKQMYSRLPERKYPIFPFDQVPNGARIVIYGAGDTGNEYYYQLKSIKYCEVVGWVDKKVRISQYRINVEEPDKLRSMKYDYVIVAILDADIAKEIVDYVSSIGVDRNKIIW